MRVPFATFAILSMLLPGCSDPGLQSVGEGGTLTFAGAPGLVVDAVVQDAEDAVRVAFTARNGSGRTLGVEDNCAARWYDVAVLDNRGTEVWPASQAVCALYSVPGPFPPGETRTGMVTWKLQRTDPTTGEPEPAPPGRYTLRLAATFHEGPGEGQHELRAERDAELVVG